MSSTRVSRADLLQRIAVRQELDRRACRKDAAVFVERHCTIEDPDGAVLPFKLWAFQHDALTAMHEERGLIVLKARRLGMSWLVLAYALWTAIFQQGIRILILCKTEGDASELLDRIRRMRDRIENDPASAHILTEIAVPAKTRDAVTALDVGASTIRALVGTPAAARSETAGLVILDEFAFQRGAGEIWRAVLPTVEGGGKLAVLSTGNGRGGQGAEFYERWVAAGEGRGVLAPLFFSWRERPDRDAEWEALTRDAIGDPDRFDAEYPETPDDAFRAVDTVFVYPPSGITAAVELGARFDADPSIVPPPEEGELHLGIDWGEHSHAVVLHPLAGGGVYVRCDVPLENTEPTVSSTAMLTALGAELDKVANAGPGSADYDAAGIQPMRTFKATRDATPDMRDLRTWACAFGKRKDETIGYLRRLFMRTERGKEMGTIAISPRCVTLIAQLRDLQFSNEDQGKVRKQNDHGPDALIAGMAKSAARHRALLDEHAG